VAQRSEACLAGKAGNLPSIPANPEGSGVHLQWQTKKS